MTASGEASVPQEVIRGEDGTIFLQTELEYGSTSQVLMSHLGMQEAARPGTDPVKLHFDHHSVTNEGLSTTILRLYRVAEAAGKLVEITGGRDIRKKMETLGIMELFAFFELPDVA